MLEFGQNIRWVTLMITGKLSDLHLGGKLVSQPVLAPTPKYPGHLFYSITNLNIKM